LRALAADFESVLTQQLWRLTPPIPPFEESTIVIIEDLKKVYGLTLTAADSHQSSDPPSSNA
jgi:hypothetical protein